MVLVNNVSSYTFTNIGKDFEKTPLYGWAAWGRLRETVKRLLAP